MLAMRRTPRGDSFQREVGKTDEEAQERNKDDGNHSTTILTVYLGTSTSAHETAISAKNGVTCAASTALVIVHNTNKREKT
jgi:hypothetical protein